MNKNSKIYVAGASGMVGSAIVKKLLNDGFTNVITERIELTIQAEVNLFFEKEKPEYVFLVAGKVGGVKANNTKRAEFIYDNLTIASNVINASYKNKVTKLLYAASSCIYPKSCQQPIREEYLLTGLLEETNEPYAIAKIAGIKLCQSYNYQYGCNFISVMPTNSYGNGDKYDLEDSHVLPALLRKIITAKENNLPTVEVWGTGNAKREFIYVDDMADAMVFLMLTYNSPEIINIGTGEEITIKGLAELIKYVTKYEGDFVYSGKLDGTERKLLDSLKLYNLGWRSKISLDEGIRKTIKTLNKIKWV